MIAQFSATVQGICDCTSEVRDKLLELTGVSECGDVTSTLLEGVTSLFIPLPHSVPLKQRISAG